MIALVSQTVSISGSFKYDRAMGKCATDEAGREKGGYVVRANGIPIGLDPNLQLALLRSCCNDKYKVKAINIVLSHSKLDRDRIASSSDLQKNKFISDFLDELRKQGVDIDNAAYIMMAHHNTDCLHYHMILLTTKFDGSRLNTNYIGKKAARAAYLASVENNLHYAAGMDARYQGWLQHVAEDNNQEVTVPENTEGNDALFGLTAAEMEKLNKVKIENISYSMINEKKRRKKAYEEAKLRKLSLKGTIESVSRNCKTVSELRDNLSQNGIILHAKDKDNNDYKVSMKEMAENNVEKTFTYSLVKDLTFDFKSILALQKNENEYNHARDLCSEVADDASNLSKTITDIAACLFLGWIVAANETSTACGGSTCSGSELGWRDKEDDYEWIRKCLAKARAMAQPRRVFRRKR